MIANGAGKEQFHIVQTMETCCFYKRIAGSLRLQVTAMLHTSALSMANFKTRSSWSGPCSAGVQNSPRQRLCSFAG